MAGLLLQFGIVCEWRLPSIVASSPNVSSWGASGLSASTLT